MSFRGQWIATLIAVGTTVTAFAQNDDIMTATSGDISEFDRLLSKQPLPPGSERVLERIQERQNKGLPFEGVPPEERGGGEQKEARRERGEQPRAGDMRQAFEGRREVQRRVLPPPQFRNNTQRPPRGPELEQGRRRFEERRQPPPGGGRGGGNPPPPGP